MRRRGWVGWKEEGWVGGWVGWKGDRGRRLEVRGEGEGWEGGREKQERMVEVKGRVGGKEECVCDCMYKHAHTNLAPSW